MLDCRRRFNDLIVSQTEQVFTICLVCCVHRYVMDIMKQITQLRLLIPTLCVLVSVLQYDTVHGYPSSSNIKIWNKHIEVSAKTLRVKAGSRVSLECDAIYSNKPDLRWYGPDRHSITGYDTRVRIEDSYSKRFLKFIIVRVQPSDEGKYICLGWFGQGFHMKAIRLVIVDTKTPPPPPPPTTTTTTAVRTQRTTTILRTTHTTPDACGFRCGDGMCLESSYVCDTFPDCVDGSDEDASACADKKICSENMVACKSDDECVSADNRCDGVPHCQDASDEAPELCNSSTVFVI